MKTIASSASPRHTERQFCVPQITMAMHLYSKDTKDVGSTTELFGKDKGLLVARPGR